MFIGRYLKSFVLIKIIFNKLGKLDGFIFFCLPINESDNQSIINMFKSMHALSYILKNLSAFIFFLSSFILLWRIYNFLIGIWVKHYEIDDYFESSCHLDLRLESVHIFKVFWILWCIIFLNSFLQSCVGFTLTTILTWIQFLNYLNNMFFLSFKFMTFWVYLIS